MYNLICSNNHPKTSGLIWQYRKDDPDYKITDSESSKFKAGITGWTPVAGNTKDVEITVTLKYLRNFCRIFEMPLIICEINILLT